MVLPTINQIRNNILSKERTSKELVREFFRAIKERDEDLHAYLEVNEVSALQQAEDIELKVERGEDIGALGGVPIAVKDNIMARGFKCTAGSKILENYDTPYDATVIRKLRDAGAIILGKTNLDEFAMGSSTENSAYGATKNPHNLERVPGGSSGGSAAAVAAGMCAASLGSDTGGSIRQPAAFCGAVGFKPTYGAVSRYGLIAMASSLDQIGPIGNCVEDVRAVFDVIRGKDSLDATSFSLSTTGLQTTNYKLQADTLTVGVPKEYFSDGIDDKVKKAVEKAIDRYEENGVKILGVSLPYTKYGLAVYYIIMPSEVSANLARYDGIRYGLKAKTELSSAEGESLLDIYTKSRSEGLGDEVLRRIMLGTHTLSSGYYDAYYLKAEKVRALIKQDFDKAFDQVDVIITLATPTPAFKFGEKAKDPVSMYMSDIFTVGANLAGLPAITLPCGRVKEDGIELPVSFQIIGRQGEDYKVLDIAEMYEKFTK